MKAPTKTPPSAERGPLNQLKNLVQFLKGVKKGLKPETRLRRSSANLRFSLSESVVVENLPGLALASKHDGVFWISVSQ